MDRIIKGVYQIKNKLTGCIYIGSSRNIEKRLRQHFEHLAAKCHSNYKLQTDYCRQGKDIFETSIVEETTARLRSQLYDIEQKWIDKTPVAIR